MKKLLPGVHIAKARNWPALLQYCKKEETRVPGTQPVEYKTEILTHFQYAEEIAKRYYERFGIPCADSVWDKQHTNAKTNLISVSGNVDILVDEDIAAGRRFAAWITTNPAWNAMWKKRYRPFISSYSIINAPLSSPCSPRPQDAQDAPSAQSSL